MAQGDRHFDIAHAVGELKGRIDTLIDLQNHHFQQIEKVEERQDKVEERVGVLEKNWSKLVGMCVGASTLITLAGWIINALLKGGA